MLWNTANCRHYSYDRESQISPTSGVPRTTASNSTSSNISPKDHRVSDFGNYRRDLAVLETSGGRIPQIQHTLPTAASPNQIAPWMSSNGSPTVAASTFGTSFYNDSSDALSQASQLSPAFRPGTGQTIDSPEAGYFGDDRRPSVASVTTASSQGSKSSAARQTYKKLQGFFGEDYPGKDEDPANHAKETRTNSFSLRHRDRKHSTATEIGAPRDSSPDPSRPRTPVPSSDVVPFLYQDSQVSEYAWWRRI
jgi:adenylate cyclase